jgi:Zn-dependent protease
MTQSASHPCPRCGGDVDDSALACPACGLFMHIPELEALTREALPLETTNPEAAAKVWEKALELLPPESEEAKALDRRIDQLLGIQPRENDPPWKATLKTVGSMIVSIVVYLLVFHWSLEMATGFVVMILIHEMGHVVALWWYKMRASPPIFIPFMGAIIDLRENPPNAKVEAIVGIAGPVAGTIGAVACYFLAWQGHSGMMPSQDLMTVAYLGFMLNLFNLLPIPPLDGGRVTAAISPWIWMLGIVGLVGLMVRDVMMRRPINFLLILVLLFALPRVLDTLLKRRKKKDPYYDITPLASRLIAVSYVALGVLLVFMYVVTRDQRRLLGFI